MARFLNGFKSIVYASLGERESTLISTGHGAAAGNFPIGVKIPAARALAKELEHKSNREKRQAATSKLEP
jgi:hypothetical protein